MARELLGKTLWRKTEKGVVVARIVETEAYLGKDDPASHSARGPTPRSQIMFGPAGFIYVYFIYGNYFMLNFVTEKDGVGSAVLIRAVEPILGIETMAAWRGWSGELNTKQKLQLTSGPAKLAMALQIDRGLNGKPIGLPHLAVCEGDAVSNSKIVSASRIGISQGQELPLRFYLKDNPYVSKK